MKGDAEQMGLQKQHLQVHAWSTGPSTSSTYDLAWSCKLSVACQYSVKSDQKPSQQLMPKPSSHTVNRAWEEQHGANTNAWLLMLSKSRCDAKTSPIKQKQQKQTSTWICTWIVRLQTMQRLSAGVQQLAAAAIAQIIPTSKA